MLSKIMRDSKVSTPCSKSIVSMISTYEMELIQICSFEEKETGYHPEENYSKSVNLLRLYRHFTNIEWQFSSYISQERI